METSAALLLVADGRFPSGGHAHSFGLEAATRELGVPDVEGVERFLEGRLEVVGRTEAAVAAHVAGRLAAGVEPDWTRLDDEVTARLVGPAQREVSRQLGRQLVRTARRLWPASDPGRIDVAGSDGPHQAVVLGWIAAELLVDPVTAARLSLHHLATAIASAATRLLGLDPFEVQGALLRRAAGPAGRRGRRCRGRRSRRGRPAGRHHPAGRAAGRAPPHLRRSPLPFVTAAGALGGTHRDTRPRHQTETPGGRHGR